MFQQLNKFQGGGTLYEYLKSSGIGWSSPHSKERKQLAAQAGIKNYTANREQNIQLLNYLQSVNSPVVGHKTPTLQKVLATTPNTTQAMPGTEFGSVDSRSTFGILPQSNLSFMQDKPKVDMSFLNNFGRGMTPYQQGGTFQPTQTPGGNTEYDTIPTYAYYAKAAQEGNQEGMNEALRHAVHVRGSEVGTDLQFLGKNLKYSSLGEIAKRNISRTKNPEMKKFYNMVNENPDLLSHFDMYIPSAKKDLAKSSQGGIKRKGGFVHTKNPYY